MANYDVVLNLHKTEPVLVARESDVASEARLVEELRAPLRALPDDVSERRTTPFLHSLAVQHAFNAHLDLSATDLRTFERLLEREFERRDGEWYAPDTTVIGDERPMARTAAAREGSVMAVGA